MRSHLPEAQVAQREFIAVVQLNGDVKHPAIGEHAAHESAFAGSLASLRKNPKAHDAHCEFAADEQVSAEVQWSMPVQLGH